MRATNPRAGSFVGASYERKVGLPVTVWQFTSSTPSPPIFEHDTQVSKSVEAITDMFFGVKMPAMSDSTPKKPVITVKPSVSDLWRLCKCSFKKKHLWWTFRRSVNSPKHCTSTTSARKIFLICLLSKGRRNAFSELCFWATWIYSAAKWLA